MSNPDKKKDHDEKEKENPIPPGSPDQTPIESPNKEIPIGDPQTQKDKAPRMG